MFNNLAETVRHESIESIRAATNRKLTEGTAVNRLTLTILALSVSLTACAYPQYVNDDYRYVPLTSFAFENRSFRIFDKPSAGKMIITPSLTTAMSDVVIRNATFGEYNNGTEKQTLERAVEAYLASMGRKCTVTGASLMYDPQWEFTYDCEIRYTAIP